MGKVILSETELISLIKRVIRESKETFVISVKNGNKEYVYGQTPDGSTMYIPKMGSKDSNATPIVFDTLDDANKKMAMLKRYSSNKSLVFNII